MKGKLVFFVLLMLNFYSNAQDELTEKTKSTDFDTLEISQLTSLTPAISMSGFIDAYYSYDFTEPITNQKPNFFFNHNRHNELSINMALIQMNYQKEKVRGAIGLMAGTYPQYNLAHEQDLMKNLFEAYGGVQLYKGLWLDAGVFGSHLGFESAISSENITLTRSLMAENSPYYLSGAKLTYDGIDKWSFLFVISNGWQNISEPIFNENKALGSQIVFTPNDKLSFNYSNWWSDEGTRSFRATRLFNDFYTTITPNDKLKVIAAVDYGMQENILTGEWDNWYAPALLVGYEWCSVFSTGVRGEYYSDVNQVIVATNTSNGFQTLGTSLNFDYKPVKNAFIRVEGKWLNSQDDIFLQPDFSYSNTNFAITTSLAVRFE